MLGVGKPNFDLKCCKSVSCSGTFFFIVLSLMLSKSPNRECKWNKNVCGCDTSEIENNRYLTENARGTKEFKMNFKLNSFEFKMNFKL